MNYEGGENDDYNNSDYNSDEENNSNREEYDISESNEANSQEPIASEDDESNKSKDDDSEDSYESEPKDRGEIIHEDEVHEEPNDFRITTPFLTKYEKARVIGVRAVQISKNAPIYYNIGDNMNMDPISIAERELKEGKIPFIIRRYLPDGSYEHWKLAELKSLDWSEVFSGLSNYLTYAQIPYLNFNCYLI